jgi:hypothetical protein
MVETFFRSGAGGLVGWGARVRARELEVERGKGWALGAENRLSFISPFSLSIM